MKEGEGAGGGGRSHLRVAALEGGEQRVDARLLRVGALGRVGRGALGRVHERLLPLARDELGVQSLPRVHLQGARSFISMQSG